jgi:serine/threonine protein kinase
VLYEMLTGTVPFDGKTDFEIKDQQIRAPAPDPRDKNPSVSEGLAEIVLTAMAKDPGERFQTCREFLEALDTSNALRPRSYWRWLTRRTPSR